jgi:hypothetical protein
MFLDMTHIVIKFSDIFSIQENKSPFRLESKTKYVLNSVLNEFSDLINIANRREYILVIIAYLYHDRSIKHFLQIASSLHDN